MKIARTICLGTLIAVSVILGMTAQLFGGRPLWPPPKHSAEYRQANMLFLHFQEALANERWDEALSLCSNPVRLRAGEWPSPKAFFVETVPIDLLLAQDFRYSTVKAPLRTKADW